ncbi:MAG: RagB/SusD family nutrient uptake outer membrane protein [Bacteroidales bacterium]|nr:RagB/SusD family nutrient uptake outer membrane protein [Bacteroidales bacterium]
MKTRILAISAFGALLCSCNFLEQPLKGDYTSETFYKNATQAELAVTAVYNGLYGNTLWYFGDVASDDSVKGGNAGDQADLTAIDNFTATSDNGCLSTYWQHSYELIARANNAIEFIPAVKMDEALRARFVAEAKFLRAYQYFNLVNIFGQIPLKLKPQLSSETIHVGLSSVETVYASIEADLEDAASVLPESYVGNDVGRATRGAALALLAKVQLFQCKYVDCLASISSFEEMTRKYSLLDDYSELFVPGAEDSDESIFAIRYANDNTASLGNNLNVWFSPAVEGGYYFNAPTQSFVDCFNENTTGGETDPRLDASIGRNGKPWFNDTVFDQSWSEATGYLVKKYVEPLSETYSKAQSTVPQHIIRYAELLLIKAEALNESEGTGAADELNKVRSRAGLNETAAAGKEELRDAIRLERRRELGFEFHRWFDIMRYGKEYASSVLPDLPASSDRFYFPIPIGETETNAGIK